MIDTTPRVNLWPWLTSLACLAITLVVVLRLAGPTQAQNAPELLFRATFDDLTTNAEVAAGAPGSNLGRDLGLTAKEGYNKKTALLLGDGEECAYEVRGNLNLAAATLSFWCRPHNWTDELRRYQKFFWVHGFEDDVPFGVYVDSPPNGGSARVVMSQGRGAKQRLYQLNGKADWDSGKWRKVDVTWDERHVAIYVNGRLGERQEIEGIAFPKFDHRNFMLVPIYHHGEGEHHNGADRSLIDDFEIWSGVLSADRILQRYMAETGGEIAPPTLVVPRAAGAVEVDGRLDDPAWAAASRVPIPIDAATMYPHSDWSYASVCYDAANIYFGFRSPKEPGPLAATAEPRDGSPWQDDSFELFLNPDPETPKDYYQFVINSACALYDARFGDADWNGDVTLASHVADDEWTLEVAIPFSELGAATPQPGDMWLGNLCRDHHRPAPAHPVYTTWAYLQGGFLATPERYGRLIFSDSTRGVRFTLSPTLNTGMLDAQAEGTPGTLSASVTSGDGVALARPVEVADTGKIAERLQGVKEGTLSVSLEDADGKVAFSHSMRFMVKEPIDVAYLPDPLSNRLGLILDLTNIDTDWLKPVTDGQAQLVVKFTGPAEDTGEETFALQGARGTHAIPLRFETGEYEMEYKLTEPGHARPMLMVKTLEVPPLPWVGTQAGITDEVLAPWTLLEYGGNGAISCWGRKYAVDGPFLRAVTNQGRDILTGPVSMELTTTEGTGRLTTVDARRTREDPNRAEFGGTANFGAAQMDVDWSTTMEYDGLTVATVTLTPPAGGSTARDLRLRFPVRPDVVRYLRGSRQMGGLKTGRVEWDGNRYEGDFTPLLWVCNETEGLAWICESEAGWAYPEGGKPVIVQGGQDAFIEMVLISREVAFEEPLTYTFGFQATPVKPMAEDRRAWNFGMHRPTKHINARNWMTGYAEQDGHFKVLNVEEAREFDAKQRAEGVRLLYYGTTSCTPDHNPTFDLYGKLWGSSYSASYPNRNEATQFRPAWVPYRLASVCPGSPSFQEFMLHYADEFLRECGVPGLYTDTDGVMACDNAYHGHGFTDIFGKTGATYTILSKRRYAMRQAAIVRSFQDERRYWMTHAHAKLVPPVHCWADFWLPGEENTHYLRGNKWWYVDTLDEVAWRAEYHGASSGLVHEFLPEFVRGTKDKTDMDGPQPTESMIAMCAVTDVNTTGAYLNAEAVGGFWGLRARLDLIDADFTGYWEPDCPVKAITEKALASAYRTDDGAIVIAIANRLPDEATIEVTVDLGALELSAAGVTAVDERAGAPAGFEAGTLAVTVGGRNYTFVSLR